MKKWTVKYKGEVLTYWYDKRVKAKRKKELPWAWFGTCSMGEVYQDDSFENLYEEFTFFVDFYKGKDGRRYKP